MHQSLLFSPYPGSLKQIERPLQFLKSTFPTDNSHELYHKLIWSIPSKVCPSLQGLFPQTLPQLTVDCNKNIAFGITPWCRKIVTVSVLRLNLSLLFMSLNKIFVWLYWFHRSRSFSLSLRKKSPAYTLRTSRRTNITMLTSTSATKICTYWP